MKPDDESRRKVAPPLPMLTSNSRRKSVFVLLRVVPYLAIGLIVMVCQAARNQAGTTAPANAQGQDQKATSLKNLDVTAVDGPSWLEHLGRHMNESSMGETGLVGPSPVQEEGAVPFEMTLPPSGLIPLGGADVYRLSCRGCHGERGEGVPPEINSMINPVRATSSELILERMKKVGAPVSATVARQLASQSEASLLHRIHNGGVNMPAFPQLTAEEVQALVGYLDLLVGVPGSEAKQRKVHVPLVHVGEDLVKGTCHTCHSSTGPNPTPSEILRGAIPPLNVMLKRVTMQQFVQKVTVGRPIVMGDLDQQYRGRMPVFYYVKPEEAAAAYMYLEHYPPGGAPPQNHTP